MKILQSRSFEKKVKKFSKPEKKTIDDLEVIMIGSHENYYRDLKSYLKAK